MNIKIMNALAGILGIMCIVSSAFAGSIVPSDAPGSHKTYSLQDIYNRMAEGVMGVKQFSHYPDYAPGSSPKKYTINDVMEKAPEPEAILTEAAGDGDVLLGKYYWGLNSNFWGRRVGTGKLILQSSGWDNECFQTSPPLGGGPVTRTTCDIASDMGIHTGQDGSSVPTSKGRSFIWGYTYPYKTPVKNADGSIAKNADGSAQTVFSPRFKNNTRVVVSSGLTLADGTVTDNATGLIWVRRVDCMVGLMTSRGAMAWQQLIYNVQKFRHGQCNGELMDGSSAGQWRLPTIRELLSLVDFSGMDYDLADSFPNTPSITKLQDALPLAQCHPDNRTVDYGDPNKCRVYELAPSSGVYGSYPFLDLNSVTVLWSSTTVYSDETQAWALDLSQYGNVLKRAQKIHQNSFLVVREPSIP